MLVAALVRWHRIAFYNLTYTNFIEKYEKQKETNLWISEQLSHLQIQPKLEKQRYISPWMNYVYEARGYKHDNEHIEVVVLF